MEVNTPKVIRMIKSSGLSFVYVNGKKHGLIQAMSVASEYRTLNVTENKGLLYIDGLTRHTT